MKIKNVQENQTGHVANRRRKGSIQPVILQVPIFIELFLSQDVFSIFKNKINKTTETLSICFKNIP